MKIDELKYMEDVNSASSEIHDKVQENIANYFNLENFEFTNEQSDKIWNAIQEVLEEYSETGDYRNYN